MAVQRGSEPEKLFIVKHHTFENMLGRIKDRLQHLKLSIRAMNRKRLHRRKLNQASPYSAWLQQHGRLAEPEQMALRDWQSADRHQRLISFIIDWPHFKQDSLLDNTLASLQAQTYPHWEVVLTLPKALRVSQEAPPLLQWSQDTRIVIHWADEGRTLAQRTHAALNDCGGSWAGRLQPGDVLRAHALTLLAQTIDGHEHLGLIYADEDRIDEGLHRFDPHFKPDFNPDLQLSTGYLGRAYVALKSRLVHACHSIASDLRQDGCFDDALSLRLIENLSDDRIQHLSQILWSVHVSPPRWTDSPSEGCLNALQGHLDRCQHGALASEATEGTFRIDYPVLSPEPKVSIIVCTKDQWPLLSKCIDSLRTHTDYPDFEIIIVNNGSVEARTLTYLADLPKLDCRIRILEDPRPFNFSAMNNLAAAAAKGSVLALLNNDIEAITADWLTHMVGHAMRDEVGCVGAKLLYPDDTVQHAGILVGKGNNTEDAVATHLLRGIPKDAPGYASRAIAAQSISAVTGACLVIRKETYLRVGGLNDTDLAVAYNDVDFCLRVGELGLRHIWTPHALMYHHESVSRGRDRSHANAMRFQKEYQYMRKRWHKALEHDKHYNINLAYKNAQFLLTSTKGHS